MYIDKKFYFVVVHSVQHDMFIIIKPNMWPYKVYIEIHFHLLHVPAVDRHPQ